MLKMAQGKRFYKLFDALMTYANEALGVNPRLRGHHPFDWSDRERAEVIDEIWENRQVIDAFVNENPRGFDTADLEVVLSWKNALRGVFYVKVDLGGAKFHRDNYTFEVSDLAKPLAGMLTHAPGFVSTALLPFDGLIVYDTSIKQLPFSMGDDMVSMFEDAFASALVEGRVVSGASQFEEAAARIMEDRLQREIDELQDDLEYEGRTESHEVRDMHHSVIAGLSGEERRAAMDEAADSAAGSLGDYVVAAVESECVKGEPTASYVDLLVSHKKDVLEGLAHLLELKGVSSLNKRQLAERIVETVSLMPGILRIMLPSVTLQQFHSIRTVFEAGGRLVVYKQTIERFEPPLFMVPFYLYAFDCGDTFELVIPEEALAALDGFEWEEFGSYLALCDYVGVVAGMVVELRGVASLDEVLSEVERLCVADASREDYEDILMDRHVREDDDFELFEIDGETYLVEYELAYDCLDRGEDALCDDGVFVGLSEDELAFVRGLLRTREGFSARPISDDMLAAGDLFEWSLAQPAAIALRDFMDEHVPDGDNDYFFSERMLETLFDISHGGYRIQDVLEFLEGNGFSFEDDRLMQKELDLLSRFFNSMPRWDNNGWSPLELVERETGRKVFYNEDGSLRKVGRNDPCPCGSGKKYKKCCGR